MATGPRTVADVAGVDAAPKPCGATKSLPLPVWLVGRLALDDVNERGASVEDLRIDEDGFVRRGRELVETLPKGDRSFEG